MVDIKYVDKKDLTAIRTGLRQSFIRSKYRSSFLKSKRIEIDVFKKDGTPAKRKAVKYKCVSCGSLFRSGDINVDHIRKVGSFKNILDIDKFFFSIWCSFDNLQILCKTCHDAKTKNERRTDSLSRKHL